MARLAQNPTPFWKGEFRRSDSPSLVTFRPGQVFVLMPIGSPESPEMYEAIRTGCLQVGLRAVRVDEVNGAGIIMRDVDRLMGEAEFLIFDLSRERPNVYYELGYAHGIGNSAQNILLLAREGTLIHFDVAPLRIHFYQSAAQLRAHVAAQLAAMKGLIEAATIRAPWWKRLLRTSA